jgi:Asp/Glu/hydantoin racemase
MKIWFQTASSAKRWPELHKAFNKHLSEAGEPGVVIEVHGTKEGGLADQYKFFETLDTYDILENLPTIKHGCYDALAIGNSMDPCVREAREFLDIPVLSHTETAIHFACMMGRNFSLIALNEKWIPTYENIVRRAGLIDRLVSVDWMKFENISDVDRLFVDEELRKLAIQEFKQKVKKFIDAGAEVIIPVAGCLTYLFALQGFYKVGGVPILDCETLLIKTTIMAVKLRKMWDIWTSRRREYASPSEEILREASKAYGMKLI